MRVVRYEDLAPLVAALRAGETVLLPTDTVYGLACRAADEPACRSLLLAKGRDLAKPSAIVAGSVGALPLQERARALVAPYLPGPYTLVVPNGLGLYRWLCGATPDRIGVRVPDLDQRLAAAIDLVGPLLLTSANAAGEPPAVEFADAAGLGEIASVGLDGGRCPLGVPSHVLDLCGPTPVTLR
jgi:tRNA threonylcarbamoyl adenosine modification protein (Sua5/YciO/YrdC/YwlC family)